MASDYDIVEAFRKIEDELIASMIRNMKRHRAEETKEGYEWSMWQVEQLKNLEKYKKDNAKRYNVRFKDINVQIGALIQAANEEGGMDQEKAILREIRKGLPAHRAQKEATAKFFKVNEQKLDALIKATVSDMERAETAILRRANDQYRKIIYNAQVYANTGAGTYEKAIDMATKDFLKAGINCVEYANGARHTLKDYAGMAIRTASKRAYLQGEGTKRQEWGIYTVIVNKRGNPCPKCLPHCGKVYIDDVWSDGPASGISPVTGQKYPLLSSAVKGGLYHPNCKDSHTTYFEGVSTPPAGSRYTKRELKDIAERYKVDQRQQYAERQVESYERLAQYSLDKENRKFYVSKYDALTEQAYRPIIKGEKKDFEIYDDQWITARKIDAYPTEVYVSTKTGIKPKALHEIYHNTRNAVKDFGVKNMPKIVIAAEHELPNAYGKYDAASDTVYYIPHIAIRDIQPKGETEYHEIWHAKQADNYREIYGEITKENRKDYLRHARKRGKRVVDAAGITEYNVREISVYAFEMYLLKRFDEVEAEYMISRRRK